MKTIISNLRQKSQVGFSLVELMIVVAIIGILSAVAIPNFKKYQAKSKTSEAKLQLSSLYTAMNSWFADYSNYSTCLDLMGFNVHTEIANRYYTVGFGAQHADGNTAAVENGAPSTCDDGNEAVDIGGTVGVKGVYLYAAGKKVSNKSITTTEFIGQAKVKFVADVDYTNAAGSTTGVNKSSSFFRAGAVGHIDTTSIQSNASKPDLADTWTIDSNKNLKNHVIGY